jgi:hypothetical protein
MLLQILHWLFLIQKGPQQVPVSFCDFLLHAASALQGQLSI